MITNYWAQRFENGIISVTFNLKNKTGWVERRSDNWFDVYDRDENGNVFRCVVQDDFVDKLFENNKVVSFYVTYERQCKDQYSFIYIPVEMIHGKMAKIVAHSSFINHLGEIEKVEE